MIKSLTWFLPADSAKEYRISEDSTPTLLWVKGGAGGFYEVDVRVDGVSMFPASRKPSILSARTEEEFDRAEFATQRVRKGSIVSFKVLQGGRSGMSVQLDLES